MRNQLWASGYRPVAVYSGDKRPFGAQWTQRARQNPPASLIEPVTAQALSTGILCDGLRAVDCDVDDPAIASEAARFAVAMLGPAPIRYRADSSRILLLYRAAAGEPAKLMLCGARGKIEVLGRGQQFVAYGVHPSGTPYSWNFDPSPHSRNSLTAVTEQQLAAFLQAIAPIVGARFEDARPSEGPLCEITFDPSQPMTERDRAYAAQALRDEYDQLGALTCGRNNALNNAAFAMGTLVANGSIEESAVREALYHAMITNGYVAKRGQKMTLGTLNSGLNAGRTKPRPRVAQNDPAPVAVSSDGFKRRTPETLSSEAPNGTRKRHVTLLRGSDIEAKPVHWLWHGFLPSGKLTILAGAGGTGKSTLAFAIAAIVTTAGVWPDGTRCTAPGNVLIWSSEDDPSDTIKPRLMAAGADASRYGAIEGIRDENGNKLPFDPASDIDVLREAVRSIGGISLLIIDPIVSAITGDMHKANDVRRNLQAIVDFAVEFGCAVLGITHFAKGSAGRNPAERVIGSQAFAALARMVLVTAKEEDTNQRVFTRAKSNNSVDVGGFHYEIEAVELATGTAIRVLWGEPIEGTSREILSQVEGDGSEDDSGNQLSVAKQFIWNELKNGPLLARELTEKAKREFDISERTLKRARKQLRVQAKRGEGIHGAWTLSLPLTSK